MSQIHNKMFQICFVTLLLQFILWLASAESNNYVRGNATVAHSRKLDEITTMNCTYTSSNVCQCPESCFTHVENTNYCQIENCYKYNGVLNKCEKSGRNYVGPLVLQAIPVTGVFGSGYANVGRWDIFGMYCAVLFGGCCFICMSSITCIVCPCCNKKDEAGDIEMLSTTGQSLAKLWVNIGGCLWAISILVLYIMGIVAMATPGDVYDANNCALTFD